MFVRRHDVPLHSSLSPGPRSPTPDSPGAGATGAPVLRRAGFPGADVTSSSPEPSESPPPPPKSGPMRSSGPAAPPVLTRWRSRARDSRCSTCAPKRTLRSRRRGLCTHAIIEPGKAQMRCFTRTCRALQPRQDQGQYPTPHKEPVARAELILRATHVACQGLRHQHQCVEVSRHAQFRPVALVLAWCTYTKISEAQMQLQELSPAKQLLSCT